MPATKKEVISVINEMKTNKSTGPKSIPPYILKISNQIICKPLTYLINLSFSNGIFPDLSKTSNFISIFKTGENQNYDNYQRILLISNPSKLMEKIVRPRLTASSRKSLSFMSDSMVFVTNYPLIHSFSYKNHYKCYEKLASRSWPVLFTLAYFFLIHIQSCSAVK